MIKIQVIVVSLTIFAITDAEYKGSIFACNHEIALFHGGQDYKTFCDAQAACVAWKRGASLIMPRTKCLNDALSVLVADVFKNKRSSRVWIGATQLHDLRHWTWVDGTLLNDGYTAWLDGEPNGKNKEQCIETKPEVGNLWNDMGCYPGQAYACQINLGKNSHTRDISLSDYATDPKERSSNFRSAQQICVDKGSTLMQIKDNHYFTKVQKKIGKYTYNKYWIGASFKNGQWTWNDGEVLNYTNWMTGKPSTNTTNKCIAMKYDGWEDFDCDQASFHFVCESAAPHTLKISDERPATSVKDVLVIECTASGIPLPDVTWYKNNTRIPEQNGTFERVYQIFGNGTSTLSIDNVTMDDAGQYQCKANNTINGAAKTAMGFADLKIVSDETDPSTIKDWELVDEDKEPKKEVKKHLCRPAIPKILPTRVVSVYQEITPSWAIPVVVVLSIIALILILGIVMLNCKGSSINTGIPKANPYSAFNGDKPDADKTSGASSASK